MLIFLGGVEGGATIGGGFTGLVNVLAGIGGVRTGFFSSMEGNGALWGAGL